MCSEAAWDAVEGRKLREQEAVKVTLVFACEREEGCVAVGQVNSHIAQGRGDVKPVLP